MVSINVSKYAGQPPCNSFETRKISIGPIYELAEVVALLNAGYQITPWTRDCAADIQTLGLDPTGLVELIRRTLTLGVYKSSEWCLQKPSGPWCACDAYVISTREWIEVAHREMDVTYYVKFAISKAGNLLLLVSCHY